MLRTKSTAQNILSKYCTLYSSDPLKPLNEEFLAKKRRKIDRKNSAGPGWFNMKAPEMTPELLNELKAVKYGRLSQPYEFHKKDDRKGYAKFFQIGTIQDNILDGKASRLKKSQVKDSITKQLLEFDLKQQFTLKKFNEFNENRKKLGLKKLKLNKNKFKNKSKKDMIIK